ncbi:hypothetical protein N0V90_001470 [Kalmusia sp. IMI 367209]|nr:hypothetical protein N0V90_001470 [Kalmusia sp. IMI 367209]
METISNVVNTASKAIWGEQPAADNETAGTEPVSGVQGKGTATEPYDQGNAADPTDPTTSNETAGKEPVSGLQGKGTATEPFDQGNSADVTETAGKDDLAGTTSLPIREKASETSSTPAATSDSFNSATAANASTAAHTSDITSIPATSSDVKPIGTTVTPSHQGADKPLAAPSSEAEVSAIKTQKDEAEELLKHDPTESSSAPTSTNLAPKTSGVAADGGDFDATKPGAGKEADRRSRTNTIRSVLSRADMVTGLLEEKGNHKGATDKSDASGAATGEKEKVSKMEKLKEKLHIGHKH